jgi:tetratricopeptide (TPR) repeat protein
MRYFYILLFLSVGLNAYAQQNDIESLRKKGYDERLKGNFDEAIINYQKILLIQASDYDAKLALAVLHFFKKDYKKSLHFYQLIYADDQTDVEALHGIGKCYIRMGKFSTSKLYLQQAINYLPENIPPYFDLAICYVDAGKFDSAIITYEQIINIDPTYAEAWGGIGKIYYWKEMPYTAISYLEKAIQLDPSNKTWQKNLDNINKVISYKPSFTSLFITESEEVYTIEAKIQKLRLSKRLSNTIDINVNTLLDHSDRNYEIDSLDSKRWYDNTWLILNFIKPKNRFSLNVGYTLSDERLSSYGFSWSSYFKKAKFKFRNTINLGYDYYYYWNEVGKNFIRNNFRTTYKNFIFDFGLLYGEVVNNYVADYYQNVYDSIANPHYAYSLSLKYQLIKNPKILLGVQHSFFDFSYQSPRYYTPNERVLNGVFISAYYELKKFYIYTDFSYNLGRETFYEESLNGEHQGPLIRYTEYYNTNLNNWSFNFDFGYSINKFTLSTGYSRFYNPYYQNSTLYVSAKYLF